MISSFCGFDQFYQLRPDPILIQYVRIQLQLSYHKTLPIQMVHLGCCYWWHRDYYTSVGPQFGCKWLRVQASETLPLAGFPKDPNH